MFWKVLGSLLLIKYGITLSQFLWMMMRLYFLPRFGMKKDLKKYGKWAGNYFPFSSFACFTLLIICHNPKPLKWKSSDPQVVNALQQFVTVIQ